MRLHLLLVCATALGLLAAFVRCGGAASAAAQGDASVEAASDGALATGADGGDAGEVVLPACPATPPQIDASCAAAASGEYCEYGPSWWLACNRVLRCITGRWQVASLWGAPCEPIDAGVCPATWAEATAFDGGRLACPAVDCQYAEGACECVDTCSGGGEHTVPDSGAWQCQAASATCPSTRPRLGTPCDSDAGCLYGYGPPYGGPLCGGCGQAQACTGGVWQGYPIQWVCPQ